MDIKRDYYLQKLIAKKHNGLIKVITGMRRCGKSYLLFTLFKKHLLESGVAEDHIVEIPFDSFESKKYRDPEVLYPYVKEKLVDDQKYYILLDEVQLLGEFESVLNGFMRIPNVDVYVTGDAGIQELNRDMRQVDRPTDVLSYPTVNYPAGTTAKDNKKRLLREKDPEVI